MLIVLPLCREQKKRQEMSRIGKQPIDIPDGVKVEVDGACVKVAGPLGELTRSIKDIVSVQVDGNVVTVGRKDDSKTAKQMHGLTRTLISNMVRGVSKGFEKKLEIIGVGYKADVAGNVVNLALGYSHPSNYNLPDGISAVADKQTGLSIKGADKQLVGQVAADIRDMRPPEPYKGKGIKYAGEVIVRKAGKAGKAGG